MAVSLDSGIHFRKTSPVAETHVLVHANDGATNSSVFDNTTAIPTAGNFTTPAIFTDTAFSTQAHFSNEPDASVLMTNGTDTIIWSGAEARTPNFLIADADVATTAAGSAIFYDYTAAVNSDDPGVVATLYKATDNKVYVYIGAIRPLRGVKFYVGRANTGASSVAVKYWSGTAWTAVSGLADGTAVAGVTLAQTGSMTFTSTVGTAKVVIIHNIVLYFYQFTFTGLDANVVTLTKTTLDMAPQAITDIWDGVQRPILSAMVGTTQNFPDQDETVQVATANFVPGDPTTRMQLTDIGGYLYLGFAESMMGVNVGIVHGNNNANSINVSYWNGATWVAVSGLIDRTVETGRSFRVPGWITWSAIASGLEQKRSFNGQGEYYYYQLGWSSFLDEIHEIDYFRGLPKPKTINSYYRPSMWQNRTVLVGEVGGHRNSLLISAYGSTCVFNGSDSLEVTDIGDSSAPTAVGALFTRYTGQFFDTLIICKDKETWILDGTGVTNYHLYKISDKYGCIAPESFKIVPVGYEIATGISRHVAIWLSATGVVLFDGNTITEIDQDIKNYFQLEKTECINAANANKSAAFVDEREREYHLVIPSGATSLNLELVFSTKRKAWYKADRGLALQCGFTAYSTTGVPYTYAGTATGFLERLEDPSVATFDGTTITRTIQTRDIPFAGWVMQTVVRYIKLITKSMSGTVTALVSHFGDGVTTADAYTVTANPVSATTNFVQSKGSLDWGNHTFHSFKIVNSNYTSGALFEPVALTGLYQDVGLDKRST